MGLVYLTLLAGLALTLGGVGWATFEVLQSQGEAARPKKKKKSRPQQAVEEEDEEDNEDDAPPAQRPTPKR